MCVWEKKCVCVYIANLASSLNDLQVEMIWNPCLISGSSNNSTWLRETEEKAENNQWTEILTTFTNVQYI